MRHRQDFVKCVNIDGSSFISVGKEYRVVERHVYANEKMIKIVNDIGMLSSYFENRFAPSRMVLTEVDRGEKGEIKTEEKEK
jgi:hypothetical protein